MKENNKTCCNCSSNGSITVTPWTPLALLLRYCQNNIISRWKTPEAANLKVKKNDKTCILKPVT